MAPEVILSQSHHLRTLSAKFLQTWNGSSGVVTPRWITILYSRDQIQGHPIDRTQSRAVQVGYSIGAIHLKVVVAVRKVIAVLIRRLAVCAAPMHNLASSHPLFRREPSLTHKVMKVSDLCHRTSMSAPFVLSLALNEQTRRSKINFVLSSWPGSKE